MNASSTGDKHLEAHGSPRSAGVSPALVRRGRDARAPKIGAGGTPALRRAAILTVLGPLSLAGAQDAKTSTPGEAAASEPVLRIDLIDNGGFTEPNPGMRNADGQRPIPWWRSKNGMEQVLERDRVFYLRTAADSKDAQSEFAEQPIAGFALLARSLEVRGKMQGKGRATIVDGGGARASFDLESKGDEWLAFQFSGDEVAQKIGHDPSPRFVLRLETASGTSTAGWRDVQALIDLPCPPEKDLHAEIVAQLDWIFDKYFTRALDDVGPRHTGFVCKDFDAVTGETLATFPIGFYGALFDPLKIAVEAQDVPRWREALEHFLEDFLTLGLQPETGLPRGWDPTKDEPVTASPQEIAAPWSFLIDVAEKGPKKYKERARAAAVKIGEMVLAHGILPDGNIAASYFPRDAAINTNVNVLRRLDVFTQLARLAALTGDARYLGAAREALAAFEFTHYWPGTWDAIDPGFDDQFGNYGARAAIMWSAQPKEPLFKQLAYDGFRHYAPLWRDALRLGGNVAADQVRCWVLLTDVARLEPSSKKEIGELLHMAARSHFKGEQYGNGAWGDVTINDFDPQTGLEVGDFAGSPQNLLNGLASIYESDLGLRTEEVRAMFTAVLRSSVTTYRKPYGFLMDRAERKGPNSARGSLRMLLGLVKMLKKL